MGVNDDLSMALMKRKLASSMEAGADYICTACPYCQMQFDTVQEMMVSGNGTGETVASILYPQLLGLSMGLDEEKLGINMNRIDISDIRSYRIEE